MQSTSTQDQPETKAETGGQEDSSKSHDTPPPVVFEAGSFLVEKEQDYLGSDVVTTGTRKQHHINPKSGNNKIYPHAIKVADGSGEILYRLDPAKGCSIVFTLKGGDTVSAAAFAVGAGKETFMIETASGKTFTKTAGTPSKKRQSKYTLTGGPDPIIERVEIVKGGVPMYGVTLSTLKYQGAELKVLVWLEESM